MYVLLIQAMREPQCVERQRASFPRFFSCMTTFWIRSHALVRETQARNTSQMAQTGTKLHFSVYGELYVIDLDNTLYFEADDHYTHVHYSSGTHFMIPFGMAKVEAAVAGKLGEDGFIVRLSRKYMVNTRRIFHINTIKQVAVLTDDHGANLTLHLPKHVLRALIDSLNDKETRSEAQ